MDKIKKLIRGFDSSGVKFGIAYFIYRVLPIILILFACYPGAWGFYKIIFDDGFDIIVEPGTGWTGLFNFFAYMEVMIVTSVTVIMIITGIVWLFLWAKEVVKE